MRVKKYNPANLSCLLLMKTLKASMKWSSFKKPTAICYQATGIKRKKKINLKKNENNSIWTIMYLGQLDVLKVKLFKDAQVI